MSIRYIGPRLRVRELPHDEYGQLAVAPLYRDQPQPIVPSRHARIIVVEQRSESEASGLTVWTVVGSWAAFTANHLEPLILGPEVQQHPGVARALLKEMNRILDEDEITSGFAIVCDAEADVMHPILERAGFLKIPGTIWVLHRVVGASTVE